MAMPPPSCLHFVINPSGLRFCCFLSNKNVISSMNRELYELESEFLSPNAFHAKFSQLTGPTSLFKKLEEKEIKPVVEADVDDGKQLARPLTPIEEAIKEPVSSFSQLSQVLRKRIKSKLEPVPGLTSSQQQAMIGVVISELSSSWSEVRSLAPDPFLSNQQNQQVERFLAIELITIAEDLYFNTVNQAKELNERGVFSSYANNSRLKAQLALEANQSFNIHKIHKRLTTAVKEARHASRGSTTGSKYTLSRQPTHSSTLTNVKSKKPGKTKMGLTSLCTQPKQTKEEKDRKRRDNDIMEIQAQMPNISVEKVEKTYGIFTYDLHKRIESEKPAEKEQPVVEISDVVDEDYDHRTPLSRAEKHYHSLPNLMVGESLLDELGVPENGTRYRRVSVDTLGINLACGGKEDSTENEESGLGKAKLDSDFLSADLEKLVAEDASSKERQFPVTDKDQDLPPLLQALSYHSTKKRKVLGNIDLNQDECDDESEVGSTIASSVACNEDLGHEKVVSFAEENKQPENKQPVQPATVSTRLPDQSVVRTSDVRVSNRVNKSDITLKSYPTVYNDLIGEIDTASVKWLDRNLYIGDEIREVYEEITKTIGTDHLLFDKDPHVETHASKADFSGAIHSTMLTGNKSDKVINPCLYRDIPPPWGRHSVDKWRNSPMFGELGRQDILNMGAQGLSELPSRSTKSYNSWLAWWRSTITTDDYFKFLSTQDNDYLTLAYHLYESDAGSSDEEGEKEHQPNARELKLKRAREQKLAEIRKLKEKFSAGYWNANSVMVGGLGKYPDITDEELGIDMSSEGSTSREGNDSKTGTSRLTNEVSSPLSLQDRLDRVWTLLCMPDALRLDMAIKYSSEIYIDKLEEVLLQWETAVKLVMLRESLITKLEDFERLASDPNRFFEKGGAGSASSRIKEAKTRKQFHHNLDKVEVRVKKTVTAIYESFGDIVTFQGRPYLEKMTSDRTEMLYWLQQERRQNAFDMARKTVELKLPEIAPVPLHHVL